MRVMFSHVWDIPLSPETVWRMLDIAFQNSRLSPVWPNELAEVCAPGGAIAEGSTVEVRYKVGPLHANAHYTISRFIPPSLLRYEAQQSHPLSGGAEISLSELPTGTRLRWQGRYQSKGIFSWSSLIWFKGFYERRFFRRFIENFRQLNMSQAEWGKDSNASLHHAGVSGR